MSELEYKILNTDDIDYGDTYADPLRPPIYEEVGIVREDDRNGAQFYDVGWWDSKTNSWYQWDRSKLVRRKINDKVICWFKLVPRGEI